MNGEEADEQHEKALKVHERQLSTNEEKLDRKSEPESPINRAPTEKDLENAVLFGKGYDVMTENLRDPFLVVWDGLDDPANPNDWGTSRQWAAVGGIAASTFMTLVSSSMIAPAVTVMSEELGVNTEIVAEMALSVSILAYTIGPSFLEPLSEVYGRAEAIQCANLFYLVSNFACGWVDSTPEIVVFIILAGPGGSALLIIGGGEIGDLYHAKGHGKANAPFTLGPPFGLAIGPINRWQMDCGNDNMHHYEDTVQILL